MPRLEPRHPRREPRHPRREPRMPCPEPRLPHREPRMPRPEPWMRCEDLGYTRPMPKTVLPDARVSPRFAGIPTFCRYPRIQDVAAANRPIDWAIYGVPFDGGVT